MAAEYRRIRFSELGGAERRGEILYTVAAHMLPSEDGRPATTANSGGYEVVQKANTVAGQSVDVRGLDRLVTVAAQIVEPLIISLNEENVGTICLSGE